MNKRITIFVASHSGALVKQVTLPRIFLMCIGFLVVAGIISAGVVFSNYITLKKKAASARLLSETIESQQNALAEQQQQIKGLVDRINMMKSQLFALHDFEKKIRVIADLESQSESAGLFGIGGVSLKEINAQDCTEERRNALVREMHQQLNLLDNAFSSQEDGLASLLSCLEDKRRLLASTPAIRPMNGGWITSRFEYRKSPFTGRREFHHGLDIAASMDTPVIASADGKVIFCGTKGGLGKAVIIDHGRGIVSRYGHLNKLKKKKGDFVSREDIIGTVGNTGQSTGPHLHYEVRVDGVPVDPEKYILN
jgi:murein DD-endopeptidase MepM/ murein hydrolase activator NlpD